MQRVTPYLIAIIGMLVAGSCTAETNPFSNTVNRPFASVCNGPQGAVIVQQPAGVSAAAVGRAAVHTAVASQHSAGRLAGAAATIERMRRHGLVGPNATARFPRTVVHAEGDELILPDLQTAAVGAAQIGAPTNALTFEFEGFTAGDQTALEDYLAVAYPKARLIYGPPAFSNTVKIVADSSIQNIQGGTYNATTNEIHIPPLTGNFPEDTYILLMLVLNAFHDDVALFYDAWEQGFIGAAAYAIQTTSGVSPGYDPIDPGPFYCMSVYEAQNHPELANSTYYPASGATNMLVWRIAMARAAWLKCYIENKDFFSGFNTRYYEQLQALAETSGVQTAQEALVGNVPALKVIASEVVPQVEGQSFFQWFENNSVLDTSVHLGPKLYVWNIPLETSVALIAELYTTLAGGDEQPEGGQASTVYWSYDFVYKLYAEEGNIIDIPSSGDSVGEGFLLPTFFNIGGPQLISIDIKTTYLSRRYFYPYGMRGFELGENNFYGGVVGNAEGTLDATGGDGLTDVEVSRGVFGGRITTAALKPTQVQVVYDNGLGQTVTRVLNIGWDSYVFFLQGSGQTRVQHTYNVGTTGLHLISLPITPSAGEAPDILGVAADRLLMAEWLPTLEGDDKYRIWPNIRPFVPGRGYWLKVYDDAVVDTFGILPSESEAASISLPIGWNIIGIPRDEPVALADVGVIFGANEMVSFADAVNAGYIQQSVFGYEQLAGYATEEVLQPFQGYWFRVLRSPGVTLVFPAITSTAGARTQSAESTSAQLKWKLPLHVAAGAFASSAAYLGVASEATDKSDALFDLQAPPAFGPAVSARFVQPAATGDGAVYLSDVRSETLPQRWEFVVSSSVPGVDITLSWPDISGLPADARPVLVDETTGKRRYMRTTSSLSIPSDGSYTERALAVELEQAGADTLVVGSLSANQTAQGVAIVYSLSSAATVDVEVLNIAGRRIATVSSGELTPAGTAQTLWSMRNSAGSLVPSGTYLVNITARTESGQQTSALRTMQIQR